MPVPYHKFYRKRREYRILFSIFSKCQRKNSDFSVGAMIKMCAKRFSNKLRAKAYPKQNLFLLNCFLDKSNFFFCIKMRTFLKGCSGRLWSSHHYQKIKITLGGKSVAVIQSGVSHLATLLLRPCFYRRRRFKTFMRDEMDLHISLGITLPLPTHLFHFAQQFALQIQMLRPHNTQQKCK